MKGKRSIYFVGLILLAAVLVYYSFSQRGRPEIKIEVTAKNWAFEPSKIVVTKGTQVILSFKGLDDGAGNGHGLSIQGYGIEERVRDGGTVTIKFVADKKGTFTFFCSVYCGTGHGSMTGVLEVG